MKNILCFGDSNTWGFAPGTGLRYAHDQRWTGMMAQILGSDYRVIEEGLNGRTTVLDEPGRGFRNGIALLPALLESHTPLDLVIVMLGTNDLKAIYHQSASQIALGAQAVCEKVLGHTYNMGQCPQILLVSPTLVESLPDEMVFAGAMVKSQQFAERYQTVANSLGLHFFDAAAVVQTSPIDGVHWAQDQHGVFAKAIGDVVTNILA